MTTPVSDPPAAERSAWGRRFIAVGVLLMVSMWVYVLYLAIGPGRQPSPDRLDDPTFATTAQDRCDAANDEVRQLPTASQARSADDRADVLVQANAIYAVMLEDLARLAPPGEPGEVVSEWLADWTIYLGDREDFAARLRADDDARLLVSPKEGDQITEFIDAFAKDNRMTACGTPADV